MARRQYLYILLIPAVLYCITKFGYAHNITESLPYKHFLIVKNANVLKGDYILFAAPSMSQYVGMNLIKQVGGVAGDQVLVEKDEVFINWDFIGVAKSHSRSGEVLAITQELTIPNGKYYVANKHIDSYDSRYAEFGLIDEKNIIGVAYPLW